MPKILLIVLLMTPDSEIPVMPRTVARNAVRLKPVICRSLDRVDCASFSISLLLSENAVELYNFVVENLIGELSCGGVTKRQVGDWATRRKAGGFEMALLGQNESTLSTKRSNQHRRRSGHNRRFIVTTVIAITKRCRYVKCNCQRFLWQEQKVWVGFELLKRWA